MPKPESSKVKKLLDSFERDLLAKKEDIQELQKSLQAERVEKYFLEHLLSKIQDLPALTEYIAWYISYILTDMGPGEVGVIIMVLDTDQKNAQIPATVPYQLCRQLRRYYPLCEDPDYSTIQKLLKEKVPIQVQPEKPNENYTLYYPFLGSADQVVGIAKIFRRREFEPKDINNLNGIFCPSTGIVPRAGTALEISQVVYLDMTGVLSFQSFRKQTEGVIERAVRNHTNLALVYVDLDDFGNLNNILGHIEGNACLKEVARIILRHTGERNLAGRFGGDEFVITLDESDISVANLFSEAIRQEIAKKFKERLESYHLALTTSIGYAICPLHGTNFVTLLDLADKAMLKAKHEGKNRVVSA